VVGKDIFSRLAQGRPPVEEPTPQPVPLAAGRLLGWIQNSWKEPVIRMREIQIYGPRPRDRESARKATEILVRHGWLVPMPTPARQHDTKMWRIAIGD
jgi:hypothetical protein